MRETAAPDSAPNHRQIGIKAKRRHACASSTQGACRKIPADLLGEHIGRYCEIVQSRELSLYMPDPWLGHEAAGRQFLAYIDRTGTRHEIQRCTGDAP